MFQHDSLFQGIDYVHYLYQQPLTSSFLLITLQIYKYFLHAYIYTFTSNEFLPLGYFNSITDCTRSHT